MYVYLELTLVKSFITMSSDFPIFKMREVIFFFFLVFFKLGCDPLMSSEINKVGHNQFFKKRNRIQHKYRMASHSEGEYSLVKVFMVGQEKQVYKTLD